MWNSGNQHNGNATKIYGVTSPISLAHPRPEDVQATKDLHKILESFNVFESEMELNHRMEVLARLNTLANSFIKDLSVQQNVPAEMASKLGGRIHTFGSYRLGVHSPGADIDALCVAPRNVTRDEFFTMFTEVLKKHPEVTECRAIEEAFVPVVKMNFDGIEIDLLFARLGLNEIPERFNLSDDMLLKNLDQKCVRSLNGCRVTDEILRLVPSIDSYRLALRAIKLWAKRREIYSNSLGYLGGVSWAMLVARICQLYPNAAAATIVQKFFLVFYEWKWPNPVLLKQLDNANLGFQVWDPHTINGDRFHKMPIITPAYPQQNSTFNVSESTKRVIQMEFERGQQITKDINIGKATWEQLLEEPYFFQKYRHFLVLLVSSQSSDDHLEWCGFVESKVRYLIGILENYPYISLAHLNPKCFDREKPAAINANIANANDTLITAPHCSMWFIGIEFKMDEKLDIDLSEGLRNFITLVFRHGAKNALPKEGMEIDARHVRRKQLNIYLDREILKRKPPIDSSSSIAAKRGSTDDRTMPMKRQKENDSMEDPPVDDTTGNSDSDEIIANNEIDSNSENSTIKSTSSLSDESLPVAIADECI